MMSTVPQMFTVRMSTSVSMEFILVAQTQSATILMVDSHVAAIVDFTGVDSNVMTSMSVKLEA